MIPKHHLDDATLLSYSAGALSTALNVVASAHLERCKHCRERLLDADRIGGALLQQQRVAAPSDAARGAMLALLDQEPDVAAKASVKLCPRVKPVTTKTRSRSRREMSTSPNRKDM